MRSENYKNWTKEEDELLIEIYPNNNMEYVLSQMQGRNESQIYNRVNTLRIKKSESYRQIQLKELAEKCFNSEASKLNRFKKGDSTWNKGLKGWNLNQDKSTLFKKNSLPHNTMPNVWISKQAKIWLDAGNEIPEGYKIVFKDGNRDNVCLENLECICFANLLRRNVGRKEIPNNLSKAIRLTNKLQKIIKTKTNE